ncbi:hypothetical protein [Carboxylicivirga caseinilyticus]|uniref:hypothetical protein n=1 Tax=Carboxylicivirga caseinilyticus TaxID=3417572 RepID=UPI003D341C06|nr:hypothetical protein [Marinilabiliaceae bacterium A049]
MEREALIDIILNDLNEMRTLVSTFKGKPLINSAFINLAKTKLNNISEELNLLEAVQNEPAPVKENTESSMTSAARTSTPAEDAEEIAESSKKFASGEASEKPQETQPVEEVKTEVKNEPVAEVKPEPVIEVKTEEATRVVAETKVITEEPPKETVEKTVEKKNTVLGEQIHTEVKSVNEQIAVKKEGSHFTQIGKPVDDVRKAIGINDRFYYQRELFGGSMELLNQTLDQLNQMDSFESARQFLQSNFKWEEDNEVSQSFIKNIQRRFI